VIPADGRIPATHIQLAKVASEAKQTGKRRENMTIQKNQHVTAAVKKQQRLQKLKDEFSGLREDDGSLLFGGTFTIGQFRVDLPSTVTQEAKSYGPQGFDGDRIPKGWDLEEIIEGATGIYVATPRVRIHDAKILTWRISEDSRPLRVHDCVLWIRLNDPAEWVLIHVLRNRIGHQDWSNWGRAWDSHSGFWGFYDHPPNNQEVEDFLIANEWWVPLGEGFKLLDAEVCSKAWKKVTGQQPTGAFLLK
jgi:hypothetical protein